MFKNSIGIFCQGLKHLWQLTEGVLKNGTLSQTKNRLSDNLFDNGAWLQGGITDEDRARFESDAPFNDIELDYFLKSKTMGTESRLAEENITLDKSYACDLKNPFA